MSLMSSNWPKHCTTMWGAAKNVSFMLMLGYMMVQYRIKRDCYGYEYTCTLIVIAFYDTNQAVCRSCGWYTVVGKSSNPTKQQMVLKPMLTKWLFCLLKCGQVSRIAKWSGSQNWMGTICGYVLFQALPSEEWLSQLGVELFQKYHESGTKGEYMGTGQICPLQ